MKKVGDTIRNFWQMLKETFRQWSEREPFNNSVVLAYFTIFSLPGLLVIIINVAGYFFEREQVMEKLTTQIQTTVGGTSADDIQRIVSNAETEDKSANTLSYILSFATLLFGATGIFYNLQQILNKMWEVKPKPKQKILKLIRDRVFSFGLVLVVGFLLLVSLVLSAMLSAISEWVQSHVSEAFHVVFRFLDILLSLGVITLLFAAIYRFLPDAKIRWKDVWAGAIMTSVLFTIAKFLLGIYFGNSDPGSTYGAAGTIVLIMLWVSYAGMILLFGAEFTQVYARFHGRRIEPSDFAQPADPDDDNGALINKKKDRKKNERPRTVARPAVSAREGRPKGGYKQIILYVLITRIQRVFFREKTSAGR